MSSSYKKQKMIIKIKNKDELTYFNSYVDSVFLNKDKFVINDQIIFRLKFSDGYIRDFWVMETLCRKDFGADKESLRAVSSELFKIAEISVKEHAEGKQNISVEFDLKNIVDKVLEREKIIELKRIARKKAKIEELESKKVKTLGDTISLKVKKALL